ncbi:M23 family metallopeptidase [Priestia flexa]|jgi:stage II sporulation protein Q|uniref:M23 family metallopeptidase n=1 Tax=Priestia flexa TaxID=86664 RepID=A0A8I1MIG5_9BACI|nr:M23 family metallopeptidase [Priestia flexa]MBN8252946.1 M23 family metallopeptidase [Priestia flexa]MBY6086709.1 M23 family metallopeptidase [Priestia flexa]MCA1202348.1 M23 family metallopeptidase [Priestia flexa]MCG7313530.1 M23 family metallopeptidase [Priestia flexa]MDW8515399.1 M23 family metallopeptidase [Priestia flexa]
MREEEKKRTSQQSKVHKLFRKRWIFPAIYLASAAIILTAVLWFQANGNNNLSEDAKDRYGQDGTAYTEDAMEVNASLENLKMPLVNDKDAVVKKPFYDDQASKKQQEAALVFYNNTYHPNTGVDLAIEGDKSFDVTAAASGTVTKAEKDPLLGFVIEVDHKDGLVTQYQSLDEATVEVGDVVKQGQVLAKAGKNLYNQEANNHVHFEIRKDGVAINPSDYFGKSVASIKEVKAAEVTEQQPTTAEEPLKDEETSKDKEESKQEDKTGDEAPKAPENKEQSADESKSNA